MSVQLLFVQQQPPHGSMIGQEGLDACLMGSAFADCGLLFVGDGLFQIIKRQEPEDLGLKDYSVSYKALEDYGVSKLYCLQSDLDERNLKTSDLIVAVESLDSDGVKSLISEAGQVLTF